MQKLVQLMIKEEIVRKMPKVEHSTGISLQNNKYRALFKGAQPFFYFQNSGFHLYVKSFI